MVPGRKFAIGRAFINIGIAKIVKKSKIIANMAL